MTAITLNKGDISPKAIGAWIATTGATLVVGAIDTLLLKYTGIRGSFYGETILGLVSAVVLGAFGFIGAYIPKHITQAEVDKSEAVIDRVLLIGETLATRLAVSPQAIAVQAQLSAAAAAAPVAAAGPAIDVPGVLAEVQTLTGEGIAAIVRDVVAKHTTAA